MRRRCDFAGCVHARHTRGLCEGHRNQRKLGRDLTPLPPSLRGMPLADRFWLKVEKTDGCWLWAGGLNGYGYGQFAITGRTGALAHRFAWELAHGPVPAGLLVRHLKCRNRRCVRVDHLALGTVKDNAEDMLRDGTEARGSVHGKAKLTEARVMEIRERHARGESFTLIAKTLGVSKSCAHFAGIGRTWTHLPLLGSGS